MSFIQNIDYALRVARGDISGHAIVNVFGQNTNITTTTDSWTLWDQGGSYTHLTADTTLYVSSTSASDTAVTIAVTGLDDTYTEVTRTATCNGQNQVALSGAMFRVYSVVVTGTTAPIGDLYIAETDTLTAGVPDTASKIKAKAPLTGIDTGTAYASYGSSHNCMYTVPAGKKFYGLTGIGNVSKNFDVCLYPFIRPQGGVWISRQPIPLYQSVAEFPVLTRTPLPEKYDIEYRVVAGSSGAFCQVQLQGILVDD